MCPEGPFNFIGYDSWWKKAKKVMDSTRHLGTKHLRGLQNLTRLMAHHGQGSKPCPLCHGCSSYSSTDRTCIDLTSHACSDFGLSCISADKLLTLQLWLDNFNPYCVATTFTFARVPCRASRMKLWILNFELWILSILPNPAGLQFRLLFACILWAFTKTALEGSTHANILFSSEFQVVQFAWVLPVENKSL